MTYTADQIHSAARLVSTKVYATIGGDLWLYGDSNRKWQPWADTEPGRSDALVLLAAVVSEFYAMDGPRMHRLAHHEYYINDALQTGDVAALQQAVMAAAVAIGETMGGGE